MGYPVQVMGKGRVQQAQAGVDSRCEEVSLLALGNESIDCSYIGIFRLNTHTHI